MPDNTSPDQTASTDIRQQKRSQRRALSETQQQQHAKAICQISGALNTCRNSQYIAFYIANDGEIDPRLLMEHARLLGKNIYLPVLSPQENSLYFAPFDADSQLELNRFNIPEPVCHPSAWKTAEQLDLIFLPLVAFDIHGNRMGMGGGFYDRTLAFLQQENLSKKPILVGLAHEIQKVEQLLTQNWDIPLDYIITEKQLYHTTPAS
jgi:5-formyltetrahydrofolate cyclo-ligase